MSLIAIPTNFSNVIEIQPKIYKDNRGWFFESFNEAELCKIIGNKLSFVQDNHSYSKKGVLRGLHYQINQPQGKLVRVTNGSVFDVVIDLRLSSTSFGKWFGLELSAENKKQLWIPPGFAHGFFVLSSCAEFLYKTTTYWDPSSERCIVWNDPELAIQWPKIGIEPVISEKDLRGIKFLEAEYFP